MHRESFLIILAVLIMVSPFAGLPLFWLEWILPILGLFVLIIGISLRRVRDAKSASSAPLVSAIIE
jgi:uncharacterized membrane protein YhaH (DUF805 family)